MQRVTVRDGVSIAQRKTIRGAIAGAVAATVWAAQMPVDKRVFGSDFDDVELLGKSVTRTGAWPLAGWLLHIQNGALFGAAYANVAPRVPLPSWARGPLLALVENFGTWPLVAVSDRLHPAHEELPRSFSSLRALAQSTWRHLLFGIVLGELERRFNAQDRTELPTYEHVISSNGHKHLHAGASTS